MTITQTTHALIPDAFNHGFSWVADEH